MHLVVLLLPTPNGYSGMFVFAPRSLLEFMTDQLLFTSDFFYVSYYGTLPQWRVFLARPERPAALAGIKLTRDAQGLHYRSSRVDFDVPPTLLEFGDSSTLQLSMSYSLSAGALDWGVGAIYVSEDKNEHRYFSLKRQPKPVQGAPKAQQDRWADMLASRGDFSPGRGHDDDYKELWRRSVVGAGYKPGDPVDLDATLLYAVASSVTNAKLPREIDDMHDQILENLRVKER
jgi:hypothetical protein